jgi:hypothetical protein
MPRYLLSVITAVNFPTTGNGLLRKTDVNILKHETILILLISLLAAVKHHGMSGTKPSHAVAMQPRLVFTENQRSCRVVSLLTYLGFVRAWLVNAIPPPCAYANRSIASFFRLDVKQKYAERLAARVNLGKIHTTPPHL